MAERRTDLLFRTGRRKEGCVRPQVHLGQERKGFESESKVLADPTQPIRLCIDRPEIHVQTRARAKHSELKAT